MPHPLHTKPDLEDPIEVATRLGRKLEREAIVRWLRAQVVGCSCCDSNEIPHEYADAIESAAHHRPSGK